MITGVVASLAAAGFKSGKSLANKVAVDRTDEYVSSAGYRTVTCLAFVAFLAVTGGLYLPVNDTYWLALAANTVLFTVHTLLLARAYKHTDVSVVAPLLALTPVATVVPAWLLLGETPTLVGLVGILLCSLGAYALNLADASVEDPLAPFRSLLADRGARYVLVDLAVIAAIPAIDKIGLQHSTPLLWVASIHIGTSVALFAFMVYWNPEWRQTAAGNVGILVGVGLLNAVVWAAQAYAYSLIQVAYVQAIKQVSLVFTVLGGSVLLGEARLRSRLLGAFLILVGAILVGLAA